MAESLDRIEITASGPKFFIGGKEVDEPAYRAVYPLPSPGEPGDAFGGTQSAGWPITSLALAVHPEQAAQANARNTRHGVSTRYDAKGKAIIPDRADRKKLIRLEGMHDNDGGFGD